MESAAQSIVSTFGQVLLEELQEIRGVGDKVVHLQDELATMNAVLRVISEADQNLVDHIVREWEKQVHDLVYDAQDCIDIYSLRIVRPIPLPPHDGVGTPLNLWARYLLARAKCNARYHYEKLVLRRDLPRPTPPGGVISAPLVFCWAKYLLARSKRIARYPYEKLVLQRALAVDIKDLLARTTIVSERRARYGIDRATLPRAAFLAPVSAASISANALRRADNPHQFVGIREQANELVRKIKAVNVLAHDEYGKIKAPVHDEDDKTKVPIHDQHDKISVAVHDQHDKINAPVHDEDDQIKASVHDEDDKISVAVHDQHDKINVPVHDEDDQIKASVHDEDDKITVAVHDQHDKINAPVHDEDDQIKASVHDQHDKIEAVVEDEDDKRLKVFYIVGFGGLGKTTLAMELCRQLEADFPFQAQVSASQAFDVQKDMKGLLVRVLQQIKEKEDAKAKEAVGQIDMMNVEELSNKIEERLRHKRYLIVIDDVWSLQAWEAIHNRLPKNNCASRIIVTTRTESVAKTASAYFLHHMEYLKPEASKELFMMRVFGSTQKGTCPELLEGTMDIILKKCGGLPLAIVSIASLLASYRSAESIEMWERVSRSIGSQMESHPTLEGMRRLVTLSYDYLPHHLKACMMYLSIFPEDYVVAKDRLLYRWIAEGLVTEKRGLTLLEVAEEYFNELISRNMIQQDKFVYRGEEVEGCRVHDMILEVMVSKSQESNFVSLVGGQYGGMPHGHGKVRRLSIHDNDHGEQGPKKVVQHHARHGFEAMKLQHVRSLSTFQRNYGLSKLLDRLGEFKLLRGLDLEDCMALQDKHMRDVCRLYLLRFLSLRSTNVSEMPRKVGNLEHLETLDIKNTYISRKKLPGTVTKLSKLEHLRCGRWVLPRGIGNMKALREVDAGILIGNDVEVAKEMGELPQLQMISIEIVSEGELKEEFSCALASSLSKTSALRSLHLECWSGSLDFLCDVSPPPLLQCLSLHGSISQLPDWISSLTHLTKFDVQWAKLAGDQFFGVLCKLPNLQSVTVMLIECKDEEPFACPEHSFPVLRILEVVVRRPTVLTFKKGSMTKLETLVLCFYGQKTSIVGLENLESLKEVKLEGWKSNPAMQRAVEQVKALSTQIKVVATYLF